MIAIIITAIIVISVIAAIASGNISDVSNAALSSCYDAVKFMLTLIGGLALFNGIMNVAKESKLTDKISKAFMPFLKLIFKDIDKNPDAANAISMNITANMLGLGNAATPFGLMAMKAMAKDTKSQTASNNMVLFVVINTASVQLIPTTVALIRLSHGSQAPLEILPAVWLSSIVAMTGGILIAKAFSKLKRYKIT